jgi:hypothetical protein
MIIYPLSDNERRVNRMLRILVLLGLLLFWGSVVAIAGWWLWTVFS